MAFHPSITHMANQKRFFFIQPGGAIIVGSFHFSGEMVPTQMASDRLASRSKMGIMRNQRWRLSSMMNVESYAASLKLQLIVDNEQRRIERQLESFATAFDLATVLVAIVFPPSAFVTGLLLANTAFQGFKAVNDGEVEDFINGEIAEVAIGRGLMKLVPLAAPNLMLQISRSGRARGIAETLSEKTGGFAYQAATRRIDIAVSKMSPIQRELFLIHQIRMQFQPGYAAKVKQACLEADRVRLMPAAPTFGLQPNQVKANPFADFKFRDFR